jgi:lipoate---protein ligase
MSQSPLSPAWPRYEWQLLRDRPLPPVMHMALDEVLLDEVSAGRRQAVLRIWEWGGRAIVLGRFQSVRNEVDLEAAARHDVRVVRRITGGGAMFIEPGNTITYSIYAPLALVAGMSTVESYAFLDRWVLDALATLGVRAWYQPINDITSAAGKIGGAAQIRRGGAVLHHVTMSYDIDTAKMLEVLRIGREKLSDKGTTSAARRVDPLRSQTGLPREAIIEQLLATFRAQHGLAPSGLTAAETHAAEQLVATKFGTDAWLSILP